MKIEVVEFYPFKRCDEEKILKGSMHIYIIDLNADLRGVLVSKKGNNWNFQFPHFYTIDQETKKRIRFPVLNFVDKKTNHSLMKEIIKEGKKYIIENFLKEAEDENIQ